MARRKGSRQPEKPPRPERPAALAPSSASIDADVPLSGPPAWRDFILLVLGLLAVGATAAIWLREPPGTQLGLLQTGVVWTVALVGGFGRLRSQMSLRRLRSIQAHGEIVSARLVPDITEEQSGLPMRHISAWLVGVLGVAASGVVWYTDAITRIAGDLSTLIVGSTVSIMLGLAVGANAVNRMKARRLARDFRTALASERLALDTLGALDVMISACLPTGDRTRFNEGFLTFVGRTGAQMQGRGWLEVIHPEDRQAALDVVARLPSNARAREHDICVRHRSGDYVWLHETLVPRFTEKGELIEFIGTAVDITSRVENEAALDKQIGDLKADLAKAQAESTETKAALAEAKAELSKTKASRNRFETSLNESREEIKTLQAAVEKSEARIAEAQADAERRIKEAQDDTKIRVRQAEEAADLRVERIEEGAQARIAKLEESSEARISKLEESLKSAKADHQQSAAENRKLQRAFEKLQDEMAQLRLQDGDLREQVARHIKETREAKAAATEAQKNESQHRSRSDRLAQRCTEIEAQLAEKDAAVAAKDAEVASAQSQAQEAGAAAAAEVQRRLHEVSAQALATQLRRQLDGTQRMIKELLSTTLEGPVQDAANNTAATVRAMSELVDQALAGAAPSPAARAAAAASVTFDLRRTAQGVLDLLGADAEKKGVSLEVEAAANLRAVYGDELEIRTALLSLTDAALALVEDGTLRMRLAEDINTGAHSTIRCEFSHSSARVKTEVLEATLATKSTDTDMPDAIKHPIAHQAAKAWRTVRAHEGQLGFQLPAEGGFSIWFTFTLARPAATPWQRTAPVSLSAAVAAAAADQSDSDDGSTAEAEPESATPRNLPRLPQEFLNCNLGEVAELGAGGMRVFCAKPPKGPEVEISFEGGGGGLLDHELRAEITWSKKVGSRKHDVGLKFVGLSAEDQKRLLRIAMQHRKIVTLLEDASG